MSDADELNAMMVKALRARAGSDPRWRRFGNSPEMGVLSGVGWANWLAERIPVRRVPGAAWALENETAVIACPCGNEAYAVAREAPAACRIEEERVHCDRRFFFDGEYVFCFNSPEDLTAHDETIIRPSTG